jgi:hypothetical protein
MAETEKIDREGLQGCMCASMGGYVYRGVGGLQGCIVTEQWKSTLGFYTNSGILAFEH